MTRSFASCRRGAAAVEAALVLPLLVSAGMAAADAGYMFSEEHRIKGGLAAGARYLAKAPDPVAAQTWAVNVAVTGRRDGAGTPRVKGWRTEHVSVSYRMIPNTTGTYTGADELRIIRFQSEHDYKGLGLLELVGVGAFKVRAAHEERWTG